MHFLFNGASLLFNVRNPNAKFYRLKKFFSVFCGVFFDRKYKDFSVCFGVLLIGRI